MGCELQEWQQLNRANQGHEAYHARESKTDLKSRPDNGAAKCSVRTATLGAATCQLLVRVQITLRRKSVYVCAAAHRTAVLRGEGCLQMRPPSALQAVRASQNCQE